MIVGVEETPQLQPAECSFLGYGKGPAKRFLRVLNPDSNTDTLLISDICFHEWAKVMGYVPLDVRDRLLQELKDEANGLGPSISSTVLELASIRGELAGIKNLEARVVRLTELLGAINGIVEPAEVAPEPAVSVSEPAEPTNVRTTEPAKPAPKPATKP